MENNKKEVAISLIGSELTRIEIDVMAAILGLSRVALIKNVVVTYALRRYLLYKGNKKTFNPIPSNLAQVKEEKKRKQYPQFRQTIKIPKETHDYLILFKDINSKQAITITDIVETWLNDAATSLKAFGSWEILIENVLKFKSTTGLENGSLRTMLSEISSGEVSKETEEELLKIKMY